MGKSSRGTSLEMRRRRDTACAGIGKRRLIRLHLWKGAKKGKRRQHGGQTSDKEMGDGNAAIDEFVAHAPDIPVYNDIPYTRAQECSPDRDNRGKRRHQGKQSKSKRGKSLYELLHGPEAEQTAFDWCVEVGLLSDGRDPGIRPYLCPKCQTATTWKTAVSRTGQGISYQWPKPCRYMESVTARETDLFLPRVPLSKQILVLYMLIHKTDLESTVLFESDVEGRSPCPSLGPLEPGRIPELWSSSCWTVEALDTLRCQE